MYSLFHLFVYFWRTAKVVIISKGALILNKKRQFIREVTSSLILNQLWIFFLLFVVLRGIFFIVNFQQFESTEIRDLFLSALYGLRLDIIPSAYLGIITTAVALVSKFAQRVIATILGVFISLLHVIDVYYFEFLKERLNIGFIHLLDSSNNISLSTYLYDYWFGFALLLLIGIVLVWVVRKTKNSNNRWRSFLIISLVLIIAARGFGYKPAKSSSVADYVNPKLYQLTYNTSLFFAESVLNPIEQPDFIDPTISIKPTKQSSDGTPKSYNYVIIILESFGKEYTGLNRGFAESYTPFLNSLMSESVVCHNAYANGLKSVDAIPAINSGIARLSDKAFIHSPKSQKKRTALTNILKPYNYTTHFFHGANNESMGFRSYLMSQGLDRYYGLNEYPKTEHHDGHWGIYDEEYFQYFASCLDTVSQPFLSAVFSLSSHHPYPIPERHKTKFTSGNIPLHKSIQYTDYALEQFFETVRSKPWFDNTIFFITADHSAKNMLHAYRTPAGKYEVPLLIYAPKILPPANIRKTVSHIDILPTIADLSDIPLELKCTGKSVFSNDDGVVCHYDNQVYHITKGLMNYGRTKTKPAFLFDRNNDINCLNNLLDVSKNETHYDSLLVHEVSKHFNYLNSEHP